MKKIVFCLMLFASFLFAQGIDSNLVKDSLLTNIPEIKVISHDSLSKIDKILDTATSAPKLIKDTAPENTDSILKVADYYKHFLDSLVDFEKAPKMFPVAGFYNSFYHYYYPLPFEKFYKINGFEANSYIVKDFHILQYTTPFYNFDEKSILNFYSDIYYIDVPYLQMKLGSNRTNRDNEYALIKLKNGEIVNKFNFELSFLGQSGKWNSFSTKDDGEDRAYELAPKLSYKNDFFAISYEYRVRDADVPYKNFFGYNKDTINYHIQENWEANNILLKSKYLDFGYKNKKEKYKADPISLDTSKVIENYFATLNLPFYNQNLSLTYNYYKDDYDTKKYLSAKANINLFEKTFFNAYYEENHQNYNLSHLFYKGFGLKAVYLKDKFAMNKIYILSNFFDVSVKENEEIGAGICYKKEHSEVSFIYGEKKISFKETIGKKSLIDTVCTLKNEANFFEIKANFYKAFSFFGEEFKIYLGNSSKYFANKFTETKTFSEVNFLPSYLTETNVEFTKELSHNNAVSIGIDYQYYSDFYFYYNPKNTNEKKIANNMEMYSLYFLLRLTRQFDMKLEVKNPNDKENFYDLTFDNPEFLITINWYMYN